MIGSTLGFILQEEQVRDFLLSLEYLIPVIFVLLVTSILITKYFANRHKTIVFDSRKIVVLRSMLGLDYGSQQLVLPSWRIEGATNPFSIRHFPGWVSVASFPFLVIALFTATLFYFLVPVLIQLLPSSNLSVIKVQISTVGIWFTILMYFYRKELFDTHETYLLLLTKTLSKILGVKLVDNFEYTIYRSKLAKFEIQRLKIEISDLKNMLVAIEDKSFYRHSGWSLKITIRAMLSRFDWTRSLFKISRKSGGSTITQQLSRTLFISDYQKTYRRKILEILLAKWLNSVLSKNEIIEMYLGSVKFGPNIYGLPAAIKHYYKKNPKGQKLTRAMSFFLIERVSNIGNNIMVDRLKVFITNLLSEGLLIFDDIDEIKQIYSNQITQKVNLSLYPKSNKDEFDDWVRNWDPLHIKNVI